MNIISRDTHSLQEIQELVVKSLKQGSLVVLPSDTVYGLCVDSTNQSAVQKLLEFKSRPPGKAVSVFVGSLERAQKYVEIPESLQKKVEAMLPGPYTLIFDSQHKTIKDIESETGTLGIRVPDFPFINRVVEQYDKPITATSANMAGRSPHHSIEAFLNSVPEKKKHLIDLIVDFGTLPRNKPSTVVDFSKDTIAVLRQGDKMLEGGDTIFSSSVSDTQNLAQKILEEHTRDISDKPTVVMLHGDLGAGKTTFVKGLGSFLGIDDIISPTYVIYYEYAVDNHPVKKLIHADLYNIQNPEDFSQLGFEDMMKPGNLMCIEWADRSEPIADIFKDAHVVHLYIDHVSETERNIRISS